jgi:hypothetical protein
MDPASKQGLRSIGFKGLGNAGTVSLPGFRIFDADVSNLICGQKLPFAARIPELSWILTRSGQIEE